MTDAATLDAAALDAVGEWVTRSGLAGHSEPDLLVGFCNRLREAGVPIAKAVVVVDTLHPVHEGHAFRWRSDLPDESEVIQYGRTNLGDEADANWRRSPFYGMLHTKRTALRKRLVDRGSPEYPVFDEMRDAGQTDYLALIQHFDEEHVIGEMDCIYSSWTTDAAPGYSDAQVGALKRLVPSLALAIKAASLARIAETLVQTYLGRDAGLRVLEGSIQRGIAERIEAVLWYSDLRSFTTITDASEPHEVIPFLNDYADAVISSVHETGGDVLKLIGDGTLAIFRAEHQADACRAALAAERLVCARVSALNARRHRAGAPSTEVYLGLHVGEVFFGNIGSRDRLDFTVVGPAVNEVSRIGAMCRSAERAILVSPAFRDAAPPEEQARLVSVGRYALRGVRRPQELFTVEPDEEPGSVSGTA